MDWISEVVFDEHGLVPVIAQEADTGEVLMLAYANHEALSSTARTRRAHYWSRSRQELWEKGSTSGHSQCVEEIRLDCDGDAVLYRLRQTGPACHTGERTCFHRAAEGGTLTAAPDHRDILSRLEEIIRTRDESRPPDSYTTYLFDSGVDKVLKKLGEEATEVVIAAKNPSLAELRAETADLMFHLLVLLRIRGLGLAEIRAELEARFGAPPRRRADRPTDRA